MILVGLASRNFAIAPILGIPYRPFLPCMPCLLTPWNDVRCILRSKVRIRRCERTTRRVSPESLLGRSCQQTSLSMVLANMLWDILGHLHSKDDASGPLVTAN